jgi:hypothetical protein
MDEAGMAEPGERAGWTTERGSCTQQQGWGDEIGRTSVAQGTGILCVGAWIDNLKRVQRWMVDLYKQ